MKIKVNVHAKDKTFSVTQEVPNKDHLAVQINTPHIVYKDRTKYTRKIKHKKNKGE